jgi:FtsP/CotA-like multicopper oxidase with cupredoxin domain
MFVVPIGPLVLAATALLLSTRPAPQQPATAVASFDDRLAALPPVAINDNRRAAGSLVDGVLRLDLRASLGVWRPELDAGPALRIEAFGEDRMPLTIPAPLVRVPEGTEIAASIRNELPHLLRMFGFCERGGAACAPIDVPAGETRHVRFRAGVAGTYHYGATTTGVPFAFRTVDDTQLSGAFIVDPLDAPKDTDRVFVITDWTSLTRDEFKQVIDAADIGKAFMALNPKFTFPINGLSWPHTERLRYRVGDTVRWRVLNLSTQAHTMHMHGFYFAVDSLGDGLRDTRFSGGNRQRVVTQLMQPGSTIAMTWTPERAGNWLFHCHIRAHVSPSVRLGGASGSHDGHHTADHDPSAGMAGMILGITVDGPDAPPVEATLPRRALTLEMRSEPNRFGSEPAFGFVLADGKPVASAPAVSIPGPTLVLKRGEPVEITLVNRLPEGTAIHWHGMELESYYDGVHGWSGAGGRVTPLIEPGGSFVVRFTPPRAGTFMYHTHLHDDRQLTSGLYGALLVLEPEETFDDSTDHVFVLGRSGLGPAAPAVLNGQSEWQGVWKAGVRHRVRLINITPSDIFGVTLHTNDSPVTWRPMTKDGAPLPVERCQPGLARQLIGVGETYDFEYQAPPGRQTLWLDVKGPGGKWHTQAHIIVR